MEIFEREQRADACGRQAGENGDRVDVAFVEHAQQDVDRQHRRQQQHALSGERLLEELGIAGKAGDDALGEIGLALDRMYGFDRLAERHVGRQIERNRHGRLLRLTIDLQRSDGAAHRRHFVQRNETAADRGNIDAPQAVGSSWKFASASMITW